MSKRRWNKNWSGRGIEIMNCVETGKRPARVRLKEVLLSAEEKLDRLIYKKPFNEFYKGLINFKMENGFLSLKQKEMIDKDYQLLFK